MQREEIQLKAQHQEAAHQEVARLADQALETEKLFVQMTDRERDRGATERAQAAELLQREREKATTEAEKRAEAARNEERRRFEIEKELELERQKVTLNVSLPLLPTPAVTGAIATQPLPAQQQPSQSLATPLPTFPGTPITQLPINQSQTKAITEIDAHSKGQNNFTPQTMGTMGIIGYSSRISYL